MHWVPFLSRSVFLAQCGTQHRSHKGLSPIRDLPIIAARIERSNYPERKRHRLSAALCPDTRHWNVDTVRSWLSLLSKCQLRWLLSHSPVSTLSLWWLRVTLIVMVTIFVGIEPVHMTPPSAQPSARTPVLLQRLSARARPVARAASHSDNCTSRFPRVTNWPESYEKMI